MDILGHISNWNTRLITDMSYLFKNKKSFNKPLYWNTSNVINMKAMFYGNNNLNNIIVFDTKNVIDMSFMFYKCYNFNQHLKLYNYKNKNLVMKL